MSTQSAMDTIVVVCILYIMEKIAQFLAGCMAMRNIKMPKQKTINKELTIQTVLYIYVCYKNIVTGFERGCPL